jgi:peptidoglycan/xylan/chitin deacetylase (PgdA/CDA1 family)
MIEIVYGHRVAERIDSQRAGPDRDNTVTIESLENFFRARSEWTAISCRDLVDAVRALSREDTPKYLFTLDDGYRDNLVHALPLLEAHGIPCLIFITTGFIDGRSRMPSARLATIIASVSRLKLPDGSEIVCDTQRAKWRAYDEVRHGISRMKITEREEYLGDLDIANGVQSGREEGEYLTWDEVRFLDGHPLITIGGHTLSHPDLRRLGPYRAWREVSGSKDRLEHQLGHDVPFFAYPYGWHNPMVKWIVRFSGFTMAFTTKRKRITGSVDRYRVPRIDLNKVIEDGNLKA